jgi:Zn-dependent protease with chaperone function
MYTNLLLFLVAIFLFTVAGVPETPWLSGWQAMALLALLCGGFGILARLRFSRPDTLHAPGYFRAEKQLSLLALITYGVTLYGCDIKYHLSRLPWTDTLPTLANLFGILIFLLYLVLMWLAGRDRYQHIFASTSAPAGHILTNIKTNLPIVLPWIILSLINDLLALLPVSGLKEFIASQWGDLLLFLVFFLFVILFFPPLVRRLWNCRPLPEGHLRNRLTAFCASQRFTVSFYLWPLFEGRALTAGVMGIIPGLRYIIITPALIESLNGEELEAVVAHEIGHVKKLHLLLYVLLLGGFSVLAGLLAEPIIYLALSQEGFTRLLLAGDISPDTILTLVGAVPLLLFLLIYFRFLFGYFIRNFERQADLFSLAAIGSARPLTSAFEKIAAMSGSSIRNQRNWHHFGIGERIDCLLRAENDPGYIARHNRKVRFSLFAYVATLLLAAVLVQQIPKEELAARYQDHFAETVLVHKARQEPERALWQRLIGDLMVTRKMEEKALLAYERALSLEPSNPEILNNLAWLLLTAERLDLRDPLTALTLARAAATLQPKGYVLDTLATAYWANGLIEEAVHAERQAMRVDPAQKRFYQAQIIKFTSRSYEDTVRELREKQQPKL